MLMDDSGTRLDQAAGLRRLMARPPLRTVAMVDLAGDTLAHQLAERLGEQGASSLVITPGLGLVHQYPGATVLQAQARALVQADSVEAVTWLCGSDVRFVLTSAPGLATDGIGAFAREFVLVVDAEPQGDVAAGLTAAYGILKQLHVREPAPRCHILVRGGAVTSAPALFSRLESVASRFLGMGLGFAGHISGRGEPRSAAGLNAQADVARRLLALAPY